MLPLTLQLFQKILHTKENDDDDGFVDEFTVINSHFCFVRNKTFAIKSSSSELERICRSETKKNHHIDALCFI